MKNEYTNVNFDAIWLIFIKEKWLLIAVTLVLVISGIGYSLAVKEEFKSEGKILPEIQSKSGSLGQFAGLAALAGVDLASASVGSDAVRPDLYPDVLKSTPFFLRLFDEKILDKNNKEIVFRKFYVAEVLDGKLKEKDQKILYPQSKNYISFSRHTEKSIKDLKERITCTYDKKTGIISISVKMPDPVIAAGVAGFSMRYLTDYIVNYRTEKLKRDLDFLGERLNLAKGQYYKRQTQKATYSDQMPLSALRLQAADLQRERIDAEYKTSSSFYNTLLQKYEEAKLKMQQETPVIKVLEPPVVANFKSEPKRTMIVLGCFFLGVFLSIILILIKNYKFFFRSQEGFEKYF